MNPLHGPGRYGDHRLEAPQVSAPTIAPLLWGGVYEDYLDKIEISLDTFCTEVSGTWVFGYVEALD